MLSFSFIESPKVFFPVNSVSMSKVSFQVFALCLVSVVSAYGADIKITGAAAPNNKQTISLTGLQQDNSAQAREFITVLKGDLLRSGWFVPVDSPSASVVIEGSVRGNSSGVSADALCKWLRGMRQQSWSKSATSDQIRDAAHSLCDMIVTRVTEKPSMASSKVIFVGRRGGSNSEIYVCDADGGRLRQITNDRKLCMSPTWIPGKNAFLYTSWLSGVAAICKVNMSTKVREVIANYPGMNNGAAASPDGTLMALLFSRSGGVDLYVQNLTTRKLTRLTASRTVNESSPSWSPDGENLVYVSDEGHAPRIYTMNAGVRQPRRMVYSSEIREAVSPEWGPSGQITFCGRSGGRYGIYVIDPATDPRSSIPQLVSPADGSDYEDPSWAPDGRHIVCTKSTNFKRSLVVLDTLGDPPQPLVTISGDWYLSNWSRDNKPLH